MVAILTPARKESAFGASRSRKSEQAIENKQKGFSRRGKVSPSKAKKSIRRRP